MVFDVNGRRGRANTSTHSVSYVNLCVDHNGGKRYVELVLIGRELDCLFYFMEVLKMTKLLPVAALVATFFKTGLKSLLKQAALSFALLLILMEISSPLRAAQGASNPAGFDIVGMKLGMSVTEIEAAIRAHDPSLPIDIRKQPIGDQNLGVGKFMEILSAGPPYMGGLPAHEIISVAFTMTQPGRAFYIGRRAPFPQSAAPRGQDGATGEREIRS